MLKYLIGLIAFVFGMVASAMATVPAEITAFSDDADTTWTAVKAVVVAIVSFLVLLRIVKLVAKR